MTTLFFWLLSVLATIAIISLGIFITFLTKDAIRKASNEHKNIMPAPENKIQKIKAPQYETNY